MAIPNAIQKIFDQLLNEEPRGSGTVFSGPLANLMASKIACEDLVEVGDEKAKRAAGELLKAFTGMLDSYTAGRKTVEDLYTTAAERAAAGKKKAAAKKAPAKAEPKAKAKRKAAKKKSAKRH